MSNLAPKPKMTKLKFTLTVSETEDGYLVQAEVPYPPPLRGTAFHSATVESLEDAEGWAITEFVRALAKRRPKD